MKTPKQPPRTMSEVYTRGMKLRFQATFEGAPLRKSAWSAWRDQERHEAAQ